MMITVKVKNSGELVATNVQVANNPYTRVLGLMFKPNMNGMGGLLLNPCNSIHTFFMRFPIDVVFISKDDVVIKVIRSMAPWKMSWIYFKARKTLELPSGSLPTSIVEGIQLEVEGV
jgi:uncharacterized membrane protein (UPF0127 family)